MSSALRTAVAGCLGFLIFFVLFITQDGSSQWRLALSRGEAVARGREVAQEFGVGASDWRWTVTGEVRESAAAWLRSGPEDSTGDFVAPVRIGVWMRSPDGSQRLRVWLDAGGRLRAFAWRGRGGAEALDGAAELRLAEAAMARLTAAPAAFKLVPGQPERDGDEAKYAWEASDSDAGVVPRIEIAVEGGAVREGRLEVLLPAEFEQAIDDRKSAVDAIQILAAMLLAVGVIASLAFYVTGSFRGLVDQRTILRSILLLTLIHLVALIGGGSWDAQNMEDDSLLESIVVGFLFAVGVIAPVVIGVWGGSYALASSTIADKLVTTEIFLKRGPGVREVASSLLGGWAASGYLASVPYLLGAVWPASPGVFFEPLAVGRLLAPVPVLPPLDLGADYLLLTLALCFGFWYPLTARYVSPGIGLRALQLAAAVFALMTVFIESPLGAAATAGVVLGLGADWLFRRGDLLAVLAVAPAVAIARQGAAHGAQSALPIQLWGAALALLCLLALPLLAVIALRGAPGNLDQEVQKRRLQAIRLENLRTAERERLLAEFSVARRAQQQMLPSVPPSPDGFQLAALCRPAREVGGDFYDFVHLGSGLLGAVVADVSGKGVPAALYMTLTKGLLQSLGREGEPPASLVCEINRHLHSVARRSVFVTMALGVIDPETGAVTCFRAGHNPLIWRRADRQESRTIMPSGLGLGLTSRQLFERSLSEETVQLAPGDAIFLYSDGIPEAMNRDGVEYGEERLLRSVARTDGLTAEQACEVLMSDVRTFLEGHPPNDDITVLVVRYSQRPRESGAPG